MYVRAVLCHCRRRLEAADEDVQGPLVRDHLVTAHPSISPTDARVAEILSTRAYDLERVESYAGAEGLANDPAEDFGPEPY